MSSPSALRDQAAAFIRANRRRISRAERFRHAFTGNPENERLLHDLLALCGVLEVTHVLGAPDASAFNEGKRSIGLAIMAELRWSEADVMRLADARAEAEQEARVAA